MAEGGLKGLKSLTCASEGDFLSIIDSGSLFTVLYSLELENRTVEIQSFRHWWAEF